MRSKHTLYEYALHRWLRPRRVRLNLSVLRFAREIDGADTFLKFVHNGPRNLFGPESRSPDRMGVVTALFGRDFRQMSVDDLGEVAWLAERVGDEDSLQRIASLTSSYPSGVRAIMRQLLAAEENEEYATEIPDAE